MHPITYAARLRSSKRVVLTLRQLVHAEHRNWYWYKSNAIRDEKKMLPACDPSLSDVVVPQPFPFLFDAAVLQLSVFLSVRWLFELLVVCAAVRLSVLQ